VSKTGTGSGSIASSPAGIDCGSTCAHDFAHGTLVTLTATAASGSSFAGWSGACSGSGSCTLTMDESRSATASFALVPVAPAAKTLTVSKTGTGSGSIASSPAGIDCGSTCAHDFAHGTQVTLTATAASGSSFAGWSGACSGSGGCTLTLDEARSATASFQATFTPPPAAQAKCTVPKVKGKTLAAAKTAIARGKCSLGTVRKAYSATMKKGRVISQKPAPGTKRAKGAKVSLVVSKGKRP
jgi:hypothetical protein